MAIAFAVSPVAASASVCFFVPTAPPATIATATSASQLKRAVFQWAALQRPARPAKFSLSIVLLLLNRGSGSRRAAWCLHPETRFQQAKPRRGATEGRTAG